MTRNILYLHDASHGWLAVPAGDLEVLKIASDVSHYSFTNGVMVYLEEDVDARLYERAAKAAGWEVTLEEVYLHGTRSRFIRRLPRYEA